MFNFSKTFVIYCKIVKLGSRCQNRSHELSALNNSRVVQQTSSHQTSSHQTSSHQTSSHQTSSHQTSSHQTSSHQTSSYQTKNPR
jgi:hypothetical protein